MEIPDGLTPDFDFVGTFGVFCNSASRMSVCGDIACVSMNSRVNSWNVLTGEWMRSFGDRSELVTAVVVLGSKLVVGYENGLIEIFYDGEVERIRLHRKKVTQIAECADGFISASVDGTLCRYSTVLREKTVSYGGCSSAIWTMSVGDGMVCAGCGDGTVRIWDLESAVLNTAVCFESAVIGVLIGEKSLFLVLKGRSLILNFETKKEIQFRKFKGAKRAVRSGEFVAVLCEKSVYLFRDLCGFNLELVSKTDVKEAVDIDITDGKVVFISKQNAFGIVGGRVHSVGHSGKITRVTPVLVEDKKCIYTFSKDKLVLWEYDDSDDSPSLFLRSEIRSEDVRGNISCFVHFSGSVLVGTRDEIWVMSEDLSVCTKQLSIPCTHLAASSAHLAVINDKIVSIFNINFEEIIMLELPESACFASFSPDGSLLCVSMINNKIDVLEIPSGNLKLSLYGHSLPVKHFAVSHDNSLLVSCGADRLTKIWGLDFGECRKTLLNDSGCVEFVHENKFVFSDRQLFYYDHTKQLKKIKCTVTGSLGVSRSFIAAAVGQGLALLVLSEFELLEDSSSDSEEFRDVPVSELSVYERFLGYLGKLSGDLRPENREELDLSLYILLEDISIYELETYFYILDVASVHLVLEFLHRCIGRNTVLNAKMFLALCSAHMNTVVTSPVFPLLRDKLTSKVAGLRDLIGDNVAKIKMLVEGFEL